MVWRQMNAEHVNRCCHITPSGDEYYIVWQVVGSQVCPNGSENRSWGLRILRVKRRKQKW